MAKLVRVKVRTPSGRVVYMKKWKKPSAHKCAVCGKVLHGTPKLRTGELRKLSKTEKRPERPYGGYLCSNCMREVFKERVRKISLEATRKQQG